MKTTFKTMLAILVITIGAGISHADDSYTFETDRTMMAIPWDSAAYFEAVLTNTGDNRDAFIVYKRDFIPEPWYAILCIDSLCLPGDTGSVVIEPGDDARISIEAYPSMSSGDGEIRATVIPASSPDSIAEITYRIASAYPTLLIGDGSEENQYRSYYENALGNAGVPFNFWDRNFSGFLYDDLINFENILIYTGDRTSDILSDTEMQALTGYFYDGNNLMLTGQGIASGLAGTDFLGDVIGAEYIDTYDFDPAVNGIINDPIGDGLSFALSGGDGANNQVEADEIRQTYGAYPSFLYTDGSFAAVNKEMDEFRSVFFAFGYEAIDNETDRNTIMERVFDWFGANTAVDDGNQDMLPGSFSLSSYPNPFNPNTTIKFEIPQAGWVRLEIFNILGRRVTKLVDEYRSAGPHTVIWDGTNSFGKQVSAGIYLSRLWSGDKTEIKKMLLLR